MLDRKVDFFAKVPKRAFVFVFAIAILVSSVNLADAADMSLWSSLKNFVSKTIFFEPQPGQPSSGSMFAPCDGPFANEIVEENCKTGNSSSEWDITGAGDLSIQGFATDISVNRGGTIRFKVDTDANPYKIDIYRLGYYGGAGARFITSVVPSVSLPQTQPTCLYDTPTGLTDCGNWAESAHWDVPVTAVSGVYIAKLTRTDTSGSSHIVFIVRNDASASDLFFQTSDTTWQAYNGYGGHSLYTGSVPGPPALNHAPKVSYNRPFLTRNGGAGSSASEDWLFNAEYPMIRWLEANGYDISYTTDVDSDRYGSLLLNHKVFMSVGHDEYWSAGQRANVETARNAGKHLAFFSGNEVYWKTRWENSIDGSGTPYRTLVSYKEGTLGENVCGTKCDPQTNIWTGLWRDGGLFPTADGNNPENALTGQISWIGSTGEIQVPDTYKNLRFWRNTSVAALGAGQTATLGTSTLGYEWDPEQAQYAASYPAHRIKLSETTVSGQTHHLSLYRHSSGAIVFGAGTVQWSWGLDGNHDGGISTPSLAMQQATVNLFADMGVQPATLQSGLTAAAASTDTTAPTSLITSPVNGSTVSGNITIVGVADGTGGAVGGVEISTDGGTTWSSATGRENWTYSWTPTALGSYNLKSRAIDDSGNVETPTAGITVTVGPRTCPCSFWDNANPAGPEDGDTRATELGVKFRTTSAGWITGIRFYKHAANTGTHIGNLWTASGTNLGTVIFTGETASGWQEASFGAPVQVAANTTYIASYFAPNGHYAATTGFFANEFNNPPLNALQNGTEDPNGVYAYSPTSAFPTDNYQGTNYWVDVVFDTYVGPDVTPPTLTGRSPGSGATGVSINASVTGTFNEALDQATVNGNTFALVDNASQPVAATVTYNSSTRTATLTPTSALLYSTTYTATLKGGGTDPRIKDIAGNALAVDQTWSFTTGAQPPPPPTEGPGGPILVVSSAANPFSRYFAEILRAEGLNEFTAMDISLVTPTILSNYDVVILGEMPIDSTQATMFSNWTNAGGTFIAMRPDADLDSLLGITPAGGTLADKYLLINTASGPGVGIVGQTIQYHGTADLYTLNGATAIATLYSDALTPTANPSVTTINVGSYGGKAIAFAYDLAKSVVYTRQGNPLWAGQSRDSQAGPIRSDNLFFPDWIDFNKVQIPQADEQQRLLANTITLGMMHRKPLPRFWYLPKGLKAAVVMTGDDHASNGPGTVGQFNWDISASPSGCSVDDWECVRGTSYMYTNTPISPAAAVAYQNQGFELALHTSTNCGNYTSEADLSSNYFTPQLATFASTFPGLNAPVTNRTHCIAWSDWVGTPKVEFTKGIRFDTNYYYWPGSWVQNRPGHFTGSGLPMRFADTDGTLVDVYQANTQMTDESGIDYATHINSLLGNALGSNGFYCVVTTNMHTDTGPHPGQIAVVNAAQTNGVPVVTAKQMLTWLDGRNNSSFGNITWNGNTLSFDITSAAGSRNMKAMLPLNSAAGPLGTLTQNGTPVAFTTQTIKGISYAFFPAPPAGSTALYVANYTPDTTPPVISNVAVNIESGNSATITWTTDEFADSRVDFGTSPSSLTFQATISALVTSHSVNLGGLTAGQTYYFRVTSADAASHSTTEPIPTNAPLSFTTPTPPCFVDDTASDFGVGATGSNTIVTTSADGEVTLAPALQADFSGSALPSGWSSGPWPSGGTTTVSGGNLTVDGARAYTTTNFGPGSSLEFRAIFTAGSFQNVGFTADGDFNAPWVVIGRGDNPIPSGVYARMNDNTAVLLSTSTLDSLHTYRIDWTPTGFAFSIDGSVVHTNSRVITTNMAAIVSDYTAGGLSPTVDWLRVTPYASSGSFTSRVFGSSSDTTWGAMIWDSTLPTGTSVAMYKRTGDTAIPGVTWTPFTLVPTSGTSLGVTSKYIQYHAVLNTTDTTKTPALNSVSISCDGIATSSGPVISNVVATPGSNGTTATITWTTDVYSDSNVDYGTSSGFLTSNVFNTTQSLSHSIELTGLTPGSTYYFRVTSKDTQLVSSSYPASGVLTFNTPFSYGCPCSIWNNTGTPANTTGADTNSVELGVKFQSSVSGYITGIKFYQGSASTGPYTGHLWDRSGNLLGSLSFSSVSGSGWQVAYFNTPIAINAGTTYVASYFAPVGNYAFTQNVFGTNGVDTPPLRALSSIDDASNGVYKYNPTSTFPTESYNNSNYWVDVVFDTNDTFPPVISNVVAAPGTNGTTATITWTTNEAATSRVDYGTVQNNLNLNSTSGTLETSHTLNLGSLVPGTTYYYRVTSVDGATNSATSPASPASPLSFTTPTPDTTPPVITAVSAAPGTGGTTATISWTTDEPATSNVLYGVTTGGLVSNGVNSSLVTNHSVTLIGLNPSTTYYYRVVSIDASNNSASFPVDPATNSFNTPVASVTDTTTADFTAGSGCGVDPTIGDGAVRLPLTVDENFSGTAVPAGWQSLVWSNGTSGGSTVAGGNISVDGARLSPTDPAGFGAGSSVEFVATYGSANYQNVGFAAGDDSTTAASGMLATGAQPWAVFGTAGSTTNLFARLNPGGDVDLGTGYLNAPHRFRIYWHSNNLVEFFIDGIRVDSRTASFGAITMRPVVSDFADTAPPLVVDWLGVNYQSPCTFTSGIFDAGSNVNWGTMTWNGSTPSGTSLAMSYRIGNSPTLDGTWSGFFPVGSSPAALAGNSRYIQYQAALATTDVAQTPTLTDANITYAAGSDSGAPTITARAPMNNAVNVNPNTNVTATFSEPMRSSTITTSSFRLRRNGDASDVAAALTVNGNSATLDPTTDLQPFSTYTVTIDTGITDVAGNPLAPESWVFTTAAPIVSATDTTVVDFSGGSGCVVDPTIGDGALRLPLTIDEGFSGNALPSGWSSHIWEGSTLPSVGGGLLTVNGSEAYTNTQFGPGTSLEFAATFNAQPFQHVGFGGANPPYNDPPWVMFSTGSDGNQLRTRVNSGSSDVVNDLGSSYLGSEHIYRIVWTGSAITFFIDGSLVATRTEAISTAMNFAASDAQSSSPSLTVNWVRVTPYVSSCTFTSRVIDAGSTVDWLELTSTGSTPMNTSVGFKTRSGNATDTNDPSWSDWADVDSPIASPNSRYIQYRATLANTDSTQTPVVESVNITYQNQPTFTVTYNGNGETGGTAPVDGTAYAYNSPVTVASPGSLVRTGYTFAGWNTAANGSGTPYSAGNNFNIVANTTLYARWTINSYTVTYDGNGNNGGTAPALQSGNYNTSVTLSGAGTLTKTGYSFNGWNTQAGGGGTQYAADASFTIPASNTTLYAQWTINTYTVSFDANGGSGSMGNQSSNYNVAANLTTNTFTRTGYTFTGWNTAANGSGSSFADGATYPFTSSVTLYAQWTINSYTITFNSNGGSPVTAITQDYGTTVTAPSNPTRIGYTFYGWYSDSGLTNPYTFTTMPALSITLYAKWTLNVYALTYTAGPNGILTGNTSQMVNHGSNGTAVTAVANSGYHFLNWSDSSTANPRTDTNVTGPINVTANFERDPSTTVYVDDDWSSVANGDDPDAGGPATSMGYDGFATIQAAVAAVATGGTVVVYSGSYNGDVDVSRAMEIRGSFTLSGHINATVPGVVVSQGANPGVINAGGFTLSTGSKLKAKINGTTAGTQYDTVNVTGAVDLGNADLELTVGFTPIIGQSYTLIANDSNDPVIGTFNGLVDGSTVLVGSDRFVIRYTGGDGNDVVLTAVAFSNTLSAPAITTLTNIPVTIPITTSDLSGAQVHNAELTLTYDTSVLNPATISASEGVVSSGATMTVDTNTAGTIVVSMSRAANLGEFSGTGTILNVNANVIGTIGSSTPLTLSNVKLNNGLIPATGTNGSLTVRSGVVTGQVSYALAPTQKVANTVLNAPGSPTKMATTDSNGSYSISDFGPESYVVTPSRTAETMLTNGAVYANDASLVAQAVVGLTTLNSNQLTAAKVSGLPTLSSFDAALIAQFAVGITNQLNQSGKWKFSPASVNYGVVTADLASQNYSAILMGDVNGSWSSTPTLATVALVPTEQSINASLPTMSATTGTELSVPLKIENLQERAVTSLQFDVEFDPAVLRPSQVAASVLGTMSENLSVVSNSPSPGLLKVAVYGALPVYGDGVYTNLKFSVVGAAGSGTPVNIANLRVNDGTDEVFVSNGQVNVVAAANNSLLSGRVLSADGRLVAGAKVILTGSNNKLRSVMTNPFGYFEFRGLTNGGTYTITVEAKRNVFSPRTVTMTDQAISLDITADQ